VFNDVAQRSLAAPTQQASQRLYNNDFMNVFLNDESLSTFPPSPSKDFGEIASSNYGKIATTTSRARATTSNFSSVQSNSNLTVIHNRSDSRQEDIFGAKVVEEDIITRLHMSPLMTAGNEKDDVGDTTFTFASENSLVSVENDTDTKDVDSTSDVGLVDEKQSTKSEADQVWEKYLRDADELKTGTRGILANIAVRESSSSSYARQETRGESNATDRSSTATECHVKEEERKVWAAFDVKESSESIDRHKAASLEVKTATKKTIESTAAHTNHSRNASSVSSLTNGRKELSYGGRLVRKE